MLNEMFVLMDISMEYPFCTCGLRIEGVWSCLGFKSASRED